MLCCTVNPDLKLDWRPQSLLLPAALVATWVATGINTVDYITRIGTYSTSDSRFGRGSS